MPTEYTGAPAPQRALGAYYTPRDIADTLTRWALNGNAGPILDPSYGTCRFLEAALSVLRDAGVQRPVRLIHGIDIDADATRATTRELVARGAGRSQFTHKDFLAVPADARFAAVLGNPPYVRHHWQDPDVKAAVATAMEEAGVKLSRRASLWAAFVVHADRFVRDDGRLAMLLPGAALQALYATPVWQHLARRYAYLTLVRIGERAFDDALEETVVLLADCRSNGARRRPLVAEVPTFDALADALAEDSTARQLRERGCQLPRVRSTLSTTRLLTIAAEHDTSTHLGEIARVRLGTVTGANAFFVRSAQDDLIRELGDDELARVVPRSRSLTGAFWTLHDDELAVEACARCRMLCLARGGSTPAVVERAIEQAEREELHEGSHCGRRDPWWVIDIGPPPDAFLAYMAGEARGIVRNELGAQSLNGVHGVTWRVPDPSRYLLSTWTSLWALAVEQTARHYAGGLLKLEPGSVRRLPVVFHDDTEALSCLDKALREEGLSAARQLADRLVLGETLGFSTAQIRTLQAAVLELIERRSPPVRP
jgi:adenine-specific DNA-methyltransferase